MRRMTRSAFAFLAVAAMASTASSTDSGVDHVSEWRVRQTLDIAAEAQGVMAARLDAKTWPPPDEDGLVVALLEALAREPRYPPDRWYVTVDRSDGSSGDLSASLLGAMALKGVRVLRGSQAPQHTEMRTGDELHYTIHVPSLREDGKYSVTFDEEHASFMMGFDAVMYHDGQGWHVVDITLEEMS